MCFLGLKNAPRLGVGFLGINNFPLLEERPPDVLSDEEVLGLLRACEGRSFDGAPAPTRRGC